MIAFVSHDGNTSVLDALDMLLSRHMVTKSVSHWDRSRLIALSYNVGVASDRLDFDWQNVIPFVAVVSSSWPEYLIARLVDLDDVLVPLPDRYSFHGIIGVFIFRCLPHVPKVSP